MPAVLIAVLFAVAPCLVLLAYAFMTGGAEQYSATLPFTTHNLSGLFSESSNATLARNTLIQGGLVATLAVGLALPVAYWINYHGGRRRIAVLLGFATAFLSSYIVRIYAFRTILGDHGVVNNVLTSLGIVSKPVSWLLFTRFSVVVALLHLALPITVLLLYIGFRPMEARFLELSDDLGASVLERWRYVVLPMIAPAAASAWILVFLISGLDYVTPTLLGGPGLATLGVQARVGFQELGNYPLGAVYAWAAMAGLAAIALLLIGILRITHLNQQEVV